MELAFKVAFTSFKHEQMTSLITNPEGLAYPSKSTQCSQNTDLVLKIKNQFSGFVYAQMIYFY